MVEVRTANQLDDLRELLMSGGDVSIAVGYLDTFGLKVIEDHLEANSNTRQIFRILVNLKDDAVSPKVVYRLLELAEIYGERLQCREYCIRGQGILHTKLFIAHSDGRVTTFITGSHNLTENALKHNHEHGVKVDCIGDEDLSSKVVKYFNDLWENDHCAIPLNTNRAELYKKNYRRNKRIQKSLNELEPPQRPTGGVRHWLFKANVYIDTFSDLWNRENRTDMWNGVRQEQARNYIRDEMRIGDRLLFYHTGAGKPKKLEGGEEELPQGTVQSAVVGTAIVVSAARPDFTAWDENSRLFYDPKDDPENPRWFLVDIQAEQPFRMPVRLKDIKEKPELQRFYERSFYRQPMVPVQRVNAKEFQEILRMGMGEQ